MPTPRKTVPVVSLLRRANRVLSTSTSSLEARMAISSFIEATLMDANQYAGFGYIPSEWEQKADGSSGLRGNHDEYRRVYYMKDKS